MRHLFQLNSLVYSIIRLSVQIRNPEIDISPVDRERSRALNNCLQLLISSPTVHDTGVSDAEKLELYRYIFWEELNLTDFLKFCFLNIR